MPVSSRVYPRELPLMGAPDFANIRRAASRTVTVDELGDAGAADVVPVRSGGLSMSTKSSRRRKAVRRRRWMLAGKLGLPAFVVAALSIALVTQSPVALPKPPANIGRATLTGWTASYPTCATSSPNGPCLSNLNTGNYPTTAKAYQQDCDVSEFSGAGNANIGSDG